jgi:hypothetical protein
MDEEDEKVDSIWYTGGRDSHRTGWVPAIRLIKYGVSEGIITRLPRGTMGSP